MSQTSDRKNKIKLLVQKKSPCWTTSGRSKCTQVPTKTIKCHKIIQSLLSWLWYGLCALLDRSKNDGMRSWKRKQIVCTSSISRYPLSYYKLDPWSWTPQMIHLTKLYESSWSDVLHTLKCEDHHSIPACSPQLQWKGEMEESPSTLTSVQNTWTFAKHPVHPSLSSGHTARLEQNLSFHKSSVTAHALTTSYLWCFLKK